MIGSRVLYLGSDLSVALVSVGYIVGLNMGFLVFLGGAIAGDTMQDLATGYIVGSTPKRQQVFEIVGIVFSALIVMGAVPSVSFSAILGILVVLAAVFWLFKTGTKKV
jgi:uncharacterized oligopeptide transporter (OPT) family protein